MDKIAIYTCIVGGYDELQQPAVVEDGFDFICFVGKGETARGRVGVWDVRELPVSFGTPTYDARWAKTHPHELLPDYAACVWIDGNIALPDGSRACPRRMVPLPAPLPAIALPRVHPDAPRRLHPPCRRAARTAAAGHRLHQYRPRQRDPAERHHAQPDEELRLQAHPAGH